MGDVRLHDPRHGAATLLLLQNVDIRTVMSIMGGPSGDRAVIHRRVKNYELPDPTQGRGLVSDVKDGASKSARVAARDCSQRFSSSIGVPAAHADPPVCIS